MSQTSLLQPSPNSAGRHCTVGVLSGVNSTFAPCLAQKIKVCGHSAHRMSTFEAACVNFNVQSVPQVPCPCLRCYFSAVITFKCFISLKRT